MSAPFRDLFVELPLALFETLQGIGEQAVRNAHPQEPYCKPSASSAFIDAVNNAFLGDRLCERFGWKSVEVWRSAVTRDTEFGVSLHCGHRCSFPIPDRLIEATPTIQIADLIADAWDSGGRACYCVPRV